MDYDQTSMPSAYDQARGYSREALAFWLEIISSAIPQRRLETILDLGCGTGRYSAGLARRFGAQVVALEPSGKMLAEARKRQADDVHYLRGSSENLPIRNASIDMVFMSMVYHHLSNPPAVARECRRVLRADGLICIRGNTADRVNEYAYLPFFPQAKSILEHDLPSAALMIKTCADAGFSLHLHEVISSQIAADWEAYADKVGLRAYSFLARLDDNEFAKGLRALRDYARTAPRGTPVKEPVDLFVFCREESVHGADRS